MLGSYAREADEINQFFRNLIHGQDFSSGIQFHGRLRHAVDRAAAGVLGYGQSSCLAQGLQAAGSIAPHSSKQDTRDVTLPLTSRALEKNVDGGMIARFACFW